VNRYRKEQRYGDEELRQLREALEQGTLFYAQGKKVSELESAFAKKPRRETRRRFYQRQPRRFTAR